MQTAQRISAAQLREVVGAIYDQGPVVVSQAYSEFSSPLKTYADAAALLDELENHTRQSEVFFSYVLHYSVAKGHIDEERIALNPKSCGGHTFRFRKNGWGLIQLKCDFRQSPAIEVRIAVNSEKRAHQWVIGYPALERPELWDWAVVNQKAGRLIRLLRKLGTPA